MSEMLEDRVRIFHEYADCPGIIVSEPNPDPATGPGWLILKCAECGRRVASIERGALEQLLDLTARPR